MKVVLFTGGRGSTVLSKRLVKQEDLSITILINGYDDGASTGAIRSFLGDCLGPSDFRKNALRFAQELRTCEEQAVSLLDKRLGIHLSPVQGREIVRGICSRDFTNADPAEAADIASLTQALGREMHNNIADRLQKFLDFEHAQPDAFAYQDCSLGNLVFAGSFLACDRDFNQAIDDFCGIVGLPNGMIVDVTDGENLVLVAIDAKGNYLPREEDIVDSAERSQIEDIFLLPDPLNGRELLEIENMELDASLRRLNSLSRTPRPNPLAISRIKEADLIVYSPGTQHSSLFPSYMTLGIGDAIASNLSAIKIFISNIHEDAEIADASAVHIVRRAVHYLNRKNVQDHPAPALITHYLFNYPKLDTGGVPYITPGNLDVLDDPRPVRIGNYEDGTTGFHDADKTLTPFIETILARGRMDRIAVFMLDTGSSDKVTQSLIQMLQNLESGRDHHIEVYYSTEKEIGSTLKANIPLVLHERTDGFDSDFVRKVVDENNYDYVVLFESSGMYHGGDVMKLISALRANSLDVVWGSRRLSVNDIHDSYRLRYQGNPLLGLVSYIGSHMLSLLYLLLYGRYVSDTLSGIRVVRSEIFALNEFEFNDPAFNQYLLSAILGGKYEILEMPVRFLPQSPQKVKRTTVLEGLKSIYIIFAQRIQWIGRSSR